VLNGDISLESEPGDGACFTLDIPFKKSEPDVNGSRLVSHKNIVKNLPEIKLLMAEDNPLNQELVKALIAELPWEMDLANNGLEAIEMIEKNAYDLILLDIQMPEKDGYEVSRYIRNHKSQSISSLPVIAITAHALSDQLQECFDAGMNDRLSKPFTRAELIEKTTQVLKNKYTSKENAVKTETLNNEIPDAFDMERLKVLSNHNEEIMRKIIDIFLSEVPYEFNDLIALNRNEKWDELSSACHKLKSSYSIIGAMKIHQKLNLIEEKCTAQKFDSVLFHGILNEAEKMHLQLIEILQKYQLANTGS
jgi:CheY-like chemotaxis protein/HPt (histidine-containing phosphotransfer) domain-containing protein